MMSHTELRRFQACHLDYFGKRLIPDGILGPKTQWALDVASLPAWRQGVIARALGEVGVLEYGTNRGDRVERWLRYAGARPGDPYCAAALSWVYQGFVPPNPGALNLVQSMHSVSVPLAGDCFCFPTGSTGRGHCGLILGVGVGEILSWEANQADRTHVLRRPLEGLTIRSPKPLHSPEVPFDGDLPWIALADGPTR